MWLARTRGQQLPPVSQQRSCNYERQHREPNRACHARNHWLRAKGQCAQRASTFTNYLLLTHTSGPNTPKSRNIGLRGVSPPRALEMQGGCYRRAATSDKDALRRTIRRRRESRV